MHEAQMHDRSCFITLTYDQVHLPANGGLNLKHWQDFAKRVRKQHGPFRFYHCGEYGETSNRAHYHALIFGLDFSEDRKPERQSETGHQLYTSKNLETLWGKGFCPIGNLTYESAAYVARYCMKKVTGKEAAQHYGDRKPPYTTMSRRPGIGKPWLDKFKTDVYPSDEVIVNGKKTRPPKFYDYVLEAENPDQLVKIKLDRIKQGRKHRSNNTPERLNIREHVHEEKLKQLKRSNN